MLFSLKQEAPASVGGGTFTCHVKMALSGQVSCGFRHGTVDARQVPLAALKLCIGNSPIYFYHVDAHQVPLAAFTENLLLSRKICLPGDFLYWKETLLNIDVI